MRDMVCFSAYCVCACFFFNYYFVLWNVIYLFLGVMCVLSLGWSRGGMALWRGEKVEPCGEGNERESWEDEGKGRIVICESGASLSANFCLDPLIFDIF